MIHFFKRNIAHRELLLVSGRRDNPPEDKIDDHLCHMLLWKVNHRAKLLQKILKHLETPLMLGSNQPLSGQYSHFIPRVFRGHKMWTLASNGSKNLISRIIDKSWERHESPGEILEWSITKTLFSVFSKCWYMLIRKKYFFVYSAVGSLRSLTQYLLFRQAFCHT